MTAPVVIYVGSSPYAHPATGPAGLASGDAAGRLAADPTRRAAELAALAGGDTVARPTALDPHRIHRDFPDRWSAYIRAHFRTVAQVCAGFEVSERTARKWWDAEGGANGGHVAVACRTHPDSAPAMLFGEG